MTKLCENCLKPSKDKVEWNPKTSKGGARHPVESFICSRCVQKMTFKAPSKAQDQRKDG